MSTEEPPCPDLSPHTLAQAKAMAAAAQDDHPEGVAIRRQVEFYFSDENLASDLHLLKQCGGRENIPVSISRICGFKKMRSYKPKALVVTALRKSTFLEVSGDGKTIKRKTPLQGKTLLDEDFFEDDEIAYDPRTRRPAVYPVPLDPQHKKEYPEGTSKNMQKPTGFEPTYTEPLLRPAEAEEEDVMYDEDKSFVERIEIAIQRFKQGRRMHEKYSKVFNKFMRFGGVDSEPRMYQGVSKSELKDMSAEEIALVLATHKVPSDRADEKQWSVDFYGVGAAFLSSWYPLNYDNTPDYKTACQVLRSFYNYLRYHRVCPEYDDQLKAALKMCDTAEIELVKVTNAAEAFPGDFNESASILLGGAQAGMFVADKGWAEEAQAEGIEPSRVGMQDQEARIRFLTGVAVLGTDEQERHFRTAKTIKVVKKESIGLEVTAIDLPNDDTKAIYAEQSKVMKDKLETLEPLGKLKCQVWSADDDDEWDLPKHKYPDGKPHKVDEGTTYEFWVEAKVLEDCFVGMKMEAEVVTLQHGLTILDEVKHTYCSFYTWLANELWMERKPKELRWLAKSSPDYDEQVEINGSNNNGQEKAQEHDEFDDE
ncbi:hypothetical protein E8E13_001101 [Curvularia kusanoi]|uniref:HTH La-type RNA-binding domain-containing protein n=1 Tax=Curvularia kusanoi TaxID=90978 RepID=A0A9P4W560_CURKU|nr:hypothetical protein E8E13_001101 [Curvularia kusanoi]